jgi:hypothetical protein
MAFNKRLARITVVAAIAACALVMPVNLASAETISVDVGTKVSDGLPITGNGQNLPSMGLTTGYWFTGPSPAPLVVSYYSSGEALKHQSEISVAALKWTRSWVKKECGSTKPAKVRACKAAAVFDIDETLFSNYELFVETDPQFTIPSSADISAANENCTRPVIAPVRALFKAFTKLGVTSFIITGRPEADRVSTATCLAEARITGYGDLIMMPTGNTQNAANRKADQRHALIKKGWKIGPSIGDQISDMANGSMQHGFLLPNLMYYVA